MSLFFKARGTSSIGLFIIRLTVGAYTLALGISQASHVETYINKIKAMNILSENTAFIVGFTVPFLLIIFGAMYIMGFFTPVTSFILALIQFIKIIPRGLFPTEGIPFNKDIIFLACFLLTLFAGAGVISFDVFLDKKKKIAPVPEKRTPPPEPVTENKNIVTAEVISETKSETPNDKSKE